MPKIYVLYENPQWIAPLEAVLRDHGLPYEMWNVACGSINLNTPPPKGVFYNRMSASAHTRGHQHAASYARALLAWLECYGCRVVNGPLALELELSKARQYAALMAAGIRIPETRVAVGVQAVVDAARSLNFPIILKPNRGGKGVGVRRVESYAELKTISAGGGIDAGPDGTLILQQYIEHVEPYIVRNEFVGGQLVYSARVDTSQGFELCPADVCTIEDPGRPVGDLNQHRFGLLADFQPPDCQRYVNVLARHGVDIAGVEMIFDKQGEAYTYDINVNTNYNAAMETRAGIVGSKRAGMVAVTNLLKNELERLYATRRTAG